MASQRIFFIYIFLIYVTLANCSNKDNRKNSDLKYQVEVPCQDDKECEKYTTENSVAVCDQNRCLCGGQSCVNFPIHKRIKKPHGKSGCKKDADCKDFQHCIAGVCICKEGYFEDNNTGVCLQEKLSEDPEGKPTKSTLEEGPMETEQSSQEEGETSISEEMEDSDEEMGTLNEDDAKPAEQEEDQLKNIHCQSDEQCVAKWGEQSSCVDTLCKCLDLHRYDPQSNKCVRDVLPGGQCAKSEDCHQPGDEDTDLSKRIECVAGDCVCKPPYRLIDGFCANSASVIASSLLFSTVFTGLFLLM